MKQQNKEVKDQFLVEFGKNVKKIRKEKKLSQLDLAMRINGDDKKISKIERGVYNFKIASLLIIAQALDVEVKELFNITNLNLLKKNILESIDNKSNAE